MNIVLKISLLISACGWGISGIAIFGNSVWIFEQLSIMGGNFEYHKMLDYWLRMTAIGFTFIGTLFGLAVLKFFDKNFNWLLAFFQILSGIILLIWINKLNINPNHSYGDVTFCLSTGVGILIGNLIELKKRNSIN